MVLSPVLGASSWSGHRPSSDSPNYHYGYRDHGNVSISSTYPGTDVTSGLSVENYDYQQNYAGTGTDVYTLRILAGENTRKDHTYSIEGYANVIAPCPQSGYCTAWSPSLNQGQWIDLSFMNWPVYFWGTAYTKLFICSNGWAAFQYSGDVNNCGVPSMPKPDYRDSNGNLVDLPDGIIAPLAKSLDDRPRSDGTTQGQIWIDYCGKYIINSRNCGFGVQWSNVMTTGGAVRCFGGPCVNTFSFEIDGMGNVLFGSGFEDPSDRVKGLVGLEDASGYLALFPDKTTAFSKGGVWMSSPHYIDGNYFVGDSKIVVDKQSTADPAKVEFLQAYVRGFNIATSNPPPPQDSLLNATIGRVTEAVTIAAVCFVVGVGGLGCLALETGGIVLGSVVQYFHPQPNPPKYTVQNILSTSQQTGYIEVPVSTENPPQCCWAADSMIFDVIQWSVPTGDPSAHHLSITYQVQLGSNGPWRSTSVDLTVDAGDFSISATPASPSSLGGGVYSATSTITLNSINNLATTISLSGTVTPIVQNGPSVSFSSTSVSLPAGGSASSIMTIQTTSSTPANTYSVAITGGDPTGVLTHSKTIPITVFADFSISANPNSINVIPGNSVASTISLASLNQFSANVPLTYSAPAGITVAFNPSTVPVVSGGTGTSTATITVPSSLSPGIYPVTVTGSSGSLSHPTTIALSYPGDFSISPSSPITYACPVMVGTTCYLGSVTVNGVNGFTGTVTLTANPSPGLSVTLNPSSLALSSSTTSATSSPGVSATTGGTYTFTVTGTSGPLSHTSATITVLFYDFSVSLSCGSPGCSYSLTQGTTVQDTLTVTSLGGFWGTVNLSVSAGGQTVSLSSSSVSLSSGGQGTVTVTITGGSGSGTMTVTGSCASGMCISPPQSHSASVYVGINCGCGGGGGSIAHGSLITMGDGSKVPVQNLEVGDKMLGYDTATGTYTISVVNSITVVDTTNMLIIHTSDGTPFRVDANPRQTLWVKTATGTIGWMPVTQIKAGDDLWTQNGWVPVTSIGFAPAGNHVMYDIIASVPYFADGYLDPIYKM